MQIYRIQNKINGKAYIGQTIQSLSRRWAEHCIPSAKYCRILHRAIRKYGKENFEIISLETAYSLNDLNALEEKYIKEQNTLSPLGYNLLKGGNNKRHHPETCVKMSTSHKGKKIPALSAPRGPCPLKTRLAISQAKKGRPNGLLGKKFPGRIRLGKRKSVIAFNRNGEKFKEFDSVQSASKFFNSSHSNICAALRGRRTFCANHRWIYARSL